jgi:hypothetical protein
LLGDAALSRLAESAEISYDSIATRREISANNSAQIQCAEIVARVKELGFSDEVRY